MKSIKIYPLLEPLKAEVAIPGSKSYTNRALLMAAMTAGSVRIINPLLSDDSEAMIRCLERLGIQVLRTKNCLEVIGDVTSIEDREYDLDVNLSGTTMRFMLALAAVIPGTKTLYGKDGLNKRPIGELVDGLRQLGGKIEYLDKEGYPPIRILSSKLSPGVIKMNGAVSSQYFSAVLMAAPLIGEVIIEVLENQISKPYIDMTIDTMSQFGVTVINKGYKKYVVLGKQKYSISKYIVEGDVSSASYFFAIAALTKSVITLKNMNPGSMQGDMNFLKILEKMGNKITYGDNEITITGTGVIKPIKVSMEDCPDQAQTLAVLASFADGTTEISGIRSLRIKETERIKAVENELKKMEIQTFSTNDSLTIKGGNPRAAKIDTYKDHRMAMAFAVAGVKLPGMEINDPDVVGKTFPDYWKKYDSIGIKTELQNNNVVLIGMRGSGKTEVAKLLSQALGRNILDVDDILVKKTRLNIPEIINKYGWEYFRKKEAEIVREVAIQQNSIISTGGGVVLNQQNVDSLKTNGFLVFLEASLTTLLSRIGNDSNRPALTNKRTIKEEIKELLRQRRKLYEDAADFIIKTDDLNVTEVVDRILLKLKEENL